MRHPVDIEWRRLLYRLRRQGAQKTVEYVSDQVRKEGYPLWFPFKLSYRLMKRGEFAAAGKLLKATRRFGQPNPLIDGRYGTWLWCTGKHAAAIKFVARQAKLWSASLLFSDLSAMYRLIGQDEEADKYLRIAGALADRELMGGKVEWVKKAKGGLVGVASRHVTLRRGQWRSPSLPRKGG